MLKRHRELVGRLAGLREQAEQCLNRVKHVEAAIALLDPVFNLDAEDVGVPVPYASIFQHGDITPAVLKILQQSNCPVCTVEIIDAILKERGNPHLDRRDRKRLRNAVFEALTLCLRRGDVARQGRLRRYAKGNAGSMRWVWIGGSLASARGHKGGDRE